MMVRIRLFVLEFWSQLPWAAQMTLATGQCLFTSVYSSAKWEGFVQQPLEFDNKLRDFASPPQVYVINAIH